MYNRFEDGDREKNISTATSYPIDIPITNLRNILLLLLFLLKTRRQLKKL